MSLTSIFRALLLGSAILLVVSASASDDTARATFSREALVADFDQLMAFITNTHPDLYRAADPQALAEIADIARAQLQDGMSLRQAWMVMAQINPQLRDAHAGLRRPVEAIDHFQEGGGQLLPIAVVVNSKNEVRVAPRQSGITGIQAGDQILGINGVSTEQVVTRLLPRMRGETPSLQRYLLSRYFAEYWWLSNGPEQSFEVELGGSDAPRVVRLDGGFRIAPEQPPFEFKMLNAHTAYMNIRSFENKLETQFAEFLVEAFAKIEAASATHLIIDLRENGGGARQLSDRLMTYLTDQPYSPTSKVKARVSEENLQRLPGATLGDVVSVPFKQTVTPTADLPLRYSGEVYLLIGTGTYSQAIVFAATVQDHQIATLVGEPTGGAANPSGQVQMHTLQHTGMQVMAPLYVFTRASGDEGIHGLTPDIPIEETPLSPRASIDALLEMLDPDG